ncbi:MAG: hypothetical protein ACOY81_09730 [Bacillota bacterium]
MVTNIERIVEETFRKARQESLSEGMAQGELKKARENALAALREGLEPQLVSRITGLSLEEVLELQKKAVH